MYVISCSCLFVFLLNDFTRFCSVNVVLANSADIANLVFRRMKLLAQSGRIVCTRALVVDFDFGQFDAQLARGLLAMKDRDKTGKLDLEEFKQLWDDLMAWKVSIRHIVLCFC